MIQPPAGGGGGPVVRLYNFSISCYNTYGAVANSGGWPISLRSFFEGRWWLMGNGRWAKALRYVIMFLAALLLLAYIGPKAC